MKGARGLGGARDTLGSVPDPSDSTSLYRRHRPGSFDEVVGQQHVVRTLRNAVEQDKVHHAYLFVGSRGTGKTSMAKILARSLNCERGGPTVTALRRMRVLPDDRRRHLDRRDRDGRRLQPLGRRRPRSARAGRLRPAGGRWKVYILDEAHMLTKEAWNAFLKTLEEPPPNTVFVLATTEAHKVMATIADRCQRFDFQRPSLEQISEVLHRVAAAEGIEVDAGAVAMIARSAQGSFRDALGTLDQLVAFGGDAVALEAVLEMLGAADADLLFDAVDAVAAEDPKGVLLGVEKMARSGRDPAQFARDLLGHLRHLLVTQTIGEVPNTFVVTATDADRLAAQAHAVGAATLVRTIDELAAASPPCARATTPAWPSRSPCSKPPGPISIRLRRACCDGSSGWRSRFPPTLLGRGLSREEGPPGEGVLDPPPAPPAAETEANNSPASSAAAESPERQDPAAEPDSPSSSKLELDEVKRIWPAVVDLLLKTAPALAATFEGARPVAVDPEERTLTIGFPASHTFNKRKAESPDKRDQVAEAVEAVLGNKLRPTYVVLDGEESSEGEASEEGVDHDALVARLKSEFDAEEVG